MRTLKVRKPYMHGADVRRVQRLLKMYGVNPGPIDGVFGPRTGSACAVAKRRLGYQLKNANPTCGDQLVAYLSGKKRRTTAMLARAAARLATQKENERKRKLRARVLAAARADIGHVEGANNDIKYNRWWCAGKNDGGAYCVRAGSYWLKKAGSTIIDPKKGRFENTDYLLGKAKAGAYGMSLTDDPKPGDGFVIDFDGHADHDHYGVVESVNESTVNTIEANATLSNGKQGVGRHVRSRHNCWFIRFTR